MSCALKDIWEVNRCHFKSVGSMQCSHLVGDVANRWDISHTLDISGLIYLLCGIFINSSLFPLAAFWTTYCSFTPLAQKYNNVISIRNIQWQNTTKWLTSSQNPLFIFMMNYEHIKITQTSYMINLLKV